MAEELAKMRREMEAMRSELTNIRRLMSAVASDTAPETGVNELANPWKWWLRRWGR